MNLFAVFYTIVHRRIADFHRRQSKNLLVYTDTPLEQAPDEEVQGELQDVDLAALLGRLSPKQREVIELYYFQKLTTSEIARRLKDSLGNVCSRLFHARKILSRSVQFTVRD